jgi:hypothetical protein
MVIIALVVIQFVLVALFGISLGISFAFLALGMEQTATALAFWACLIGGALVLFFRPFPAMWNWLIGIGAFVLAAALYMGWV